MMARLHLAGALLAALALACAGCTADPPPAPARPEAPPADAATLARIDAAGDRALLTLVVRPDAAMKTLAALAPRVARLSPELSAVAADPGKALTDLLGPLPGWDRSQSIVAALFEPAYALPAGALTPILPDPLDAAGAPPLRHRILIPASDAPALGAALTDALQRLGWSAAGEFLDGGGGHRAWIFAEADRVRVELSSHGAAPADWSIPGGPSARTPALAALAASDAGPIGALMRPWHLRAVFTQLGAWSVARALAYAASEIAPEMAARGMAILLAGEALMTADGAEFDDWTLTLGGGADGLDLRAVISLTPTGAALYDRAGDHPPLLPGDGAVGLAAFAGDLRAMLDATARPEGLTEAEHPDAVGRAYAECGIACPLHALTRRPLATLGVLAALAARGNPALPASIRAPQVAFFGLGDGGPQLAAALQLPASADVGPLREAARSLGMPGLAVSTRALSETRQAVIFAIGVTGEAAFASTGAPSEDPPLLGLSLRAERLTGRLPPDVAAAVGMIGGVEGRLDRAGGALIGQLRVGLDQPPGPLAAPDPITTEYPSPQVAAAETPASACLRRAVRELGRVLSAISAAERSMRGTLMSHGLSEIEPHLACAAADPTLAPAVMGLRRLALLPLLERELTGWQPAGAEALLRPLCTAGDALVCARLTAARAQPALELPALAELTPAAEGCPGPLEAGVTLRVTAGATPALLLGGAPLPPDAAARMARLKAARGPIQLGVDRAAPWSAVRPVIDALIDAGHDAVTLVGIAQGEPRGAPVHLRHPPRPPDEPAPDPRIARLTRHLVDGAPLRLGAADAALVDGRLVDPQALRGRAADDDDGPPLIDVHPADDVPWQRVADHLVGACPAAALATGPAPPSTAVDPALFGALQPGVGRGDDGPRTGFGTAPDLGELGRIGRPVRPTDQGLGRDDIRAVIRRHQPQVRACYEAGLRLNPELAGKATVRFTVGADGAVSGVEVREGLKSPAVNDCLREAVQRMRFPAAPGASTITYPFIFEPG